MWRATHGGRAGLRGWRVVGVRRHAGGEDVWTSVLARQCGYARHLCASLDDQPARRASPGAAPHGGGWSRYARGRRQRPAGARETADAGEADDAAEATGPARIPAPPEGLPVGEDGWTRLELPADARKIHVSSSQGHDVQGNGSAEAPYATLERAWSAVRPSFGDWILLRRGDVWTEEWFRGKPKSGPSPDVPLVVGAYGEAKERPRIEAGRNPVFMVDRKSQWQNVALVGLHLKCIEKKAPISALRCLGSVKNLLLEDMMVEGFGTNLVFSPNLREWPQGNESIRIRRCIIVDAASSRGHSQGLFIKETKGLLVEECVLDHNGWRPDDPKFRPTAFNQNMYIAAQQSGHVIRNNIVARAAAVGIFARSGGDISGNVVFDCPKLDRFGYGESQRGVSGVISTGRVFGNVVTAGGTDRECGVGITTINAEDTDVSYNIVAQNPATGRVGIVGLVPASSQANGPGIRLDIHHNVIYRWFVGVRMNNDAYEACKLRHNIVQCLDPEGFPVYIRDDGAVEHWQGEGNQYFGNRDAAQLFFVAKRRMAFAEFAKAMSDKTSREAKVAFPSPDRSIADYEESGSLVNFLAEARKQSRMNWRAAFTAQAVAAWFRANFGVTLPAEGGDK